MPSERADEEAWRRDRASSGGGPARPKPGGDPIDRRRHPRFAVDECDLTLTRSGLMNTIGLRKENLGKSLLDMSEGGMRVRTTEKLDVGARVRVRIVMTKYSDEIEAVGEVRWSFTHPTRANDHTAGIMFTKIDPQHTRKIVNMKNWFLSPQYRQKRDQKERTRPKDWMDLLE